MDDFCRCGGLANQAPCERQHLDYVSQLFVLFLERLKKCPTAEFREVGVFRTRSGDRFQASLPTLSVSREYYDRQRNKKS